MSLFDKLQKLSSSPNPEEQCTNEELKRHGSEQPTQADTTLSGTSCSVCGAPQYVTPGGPCCKNGHGGDDPMKSESCVPNGSILDRLRALGDQKQINPPPVPVSEAPGSEGETEGHTICIDAPANVCPTCGKVFKHLSRHKCKGPETPAEATTPSEAEPVAPTLPKLEGGTTRLVVLFDALYEKCADSDPILLSDILAPLAAAVAKENGQLHWSTVDYAKGGGLLAAKLQHWLVSSSFCGTILVDSSTPEARAVKEVLRRMATVVIKGVQ